MRNHGKLTLLAITMLAAMMWPTSVASGQTIEVTEEPGTDHCVECPISMVSESQTVILGHNLEHTGEAVHIVCDDVFTGYINENGDGAVTHAAPTGQNCFSVPCATAQGQVPWFFQIDETGASTEHIVITLCLFGADGTFNFCTIEADATTLPGHQYEIAANDAGCAESENEFTGHWIVDGPFEIAHL